jgi:hypothetical protein
LVQKLYLFPPFSENDIFPLSQHAVFLLPSCPFCHNCPRFFIYTQLFMCSGRVHDPTSQFSSRPLFLICKFRRQGGTEAF